MTHDVERRLGPDRRVTTDAVRGAAAGTAAGRTLVVLLCMHRSGSSVTTEILSRLGMSLGPFELLPPDENNEAGYFEPFPFYELDRRLQQIALGYADDMPEDAETLERLRRSGGRWDLDDLRLDGAWFARGEELIGQLIGSARVSGLKEPRVLMLWPFWSRVIRRFEGLRVVPVFVLRSPHEVAMSLFQRSRGRLAYRDALEVTAIHFERMLELRRQWDEPPAVVRYDPRWFAGDLRAVARRAGLVWNEAALEECYRPGLRHHEPLPVAHRAQRLHDELAGAATGEPRGDDLDRAERDADRREAILRRATEDARDEAEAYRRARREIDAKLAVLAAREAELAYIKSTRTWRLRTWLGGALRRLRLRGRGEAGRPVARPLPLPTATDISQEGERCRKSA